MIKIKTQMKDKLIRNLYSNPQIKCSPFYLCAFEFPVISYQFITIHSFYQ